MKCLVVDDSNATLFVTKKHMNTLGFDVLEAKTIGQCMTQLGEHDFDVHVIDIFLGEESGVDDINKEKELKALGIADYLQKPTTLEKLHVSLTKIGLIK